ncbi:hypothetical protein A2U01_0076931 [Trifolium medium]|uniref:Uncharacterized protein n=1 Tax=Trifolium medium TaxID=97028 RepID=A0A392T695_9FABA|nr:hypothetical protein [Trifolium medium]
MVGVSVGGMEVNWLGVFEEVVTSGVDGRGVMESSSEEGGGENCESSLVEVGGDCVDG